MALSIPSPSFAKPPLEEVALAIQFQPSAIDLVSVAEFARLVADDFPLREEQPARPPMREDFLVGPQPQFRFQIVSAPVAPRVWMLSETRTRLLQLQSDLIAYNWRKSPDGTPTDEEYPHYSKLREELAQRVARLEGISTRSGDPLKPNWCEVTYINHIAPFDDSASRPPLDTVLRGIRPFGARFLPEPEDASATVRFVIPDGGQPRGRLNINLSAAVLTAEALPIWVLTLTARLMHSGEETMNAALKTLDVGHDWVVNGFVDVTSQQMHELWERKA